MKLTADLLMLLERIAESPRTVPSLPEGCRELERGGLVSIGLVKDSAHFVEITSEGIKALARATRRS